MGSYANFDIQANLQKNTRNQNQPDNLGCIITNIAISFRIISCHISHNISLGAYVLVSSDQVDV